MADLFNSMIRALGGVAISVILVAIVWTIYINRADVSELAAPIVDPLLDSAAKGESGRS